MSKKYLITFYASQSNLQEKDEMTFTAPGEYYEENGIRIVKYKEYSEDSQLEGDYSLNTIKIVNDSKLSILIQLFSICNFAITNSWISIAF